MYRHAYLQQDRKFIQSGHKPSSLCLFGFNIWLKLEWIRKEQKNWTRKCLHTLSKNGESNAIWIKIELSKICSNVKKNQIEDLIPCMHRRIASQEKFLNFSGRFRSCGTGNFIWLSSKGNQKPTIAKKIVFLLIKHDWFSIYINVCECVIKKVS
jgi:hypothetical protein